MKQEPHSVELVNMNHVQFLDAQLWLRRVRASDWRDSDNSDGGGTADPTRNSALYQLLPPSTEPVTTANAPTAWCCFHVGSRFCFFAAGDGDEDPTQFQLELQVHRSSACKSELLARFDAKHVFVVDLRRVRDVMLPKPAVAVPPQSSDTTDATPASQEQQEPLPFGSLEFQNVSLRVWMDPQLVPAAAARHMLQHTLLRIQQLVLHARQAKTHGVIGTASLRDASWRDAFRYTRRLMVRERSASSSSSSSSASSAALPRMTPAELLDQARRIFKRDADVEAVKLASAQIVRDRQSSGSRRSRSESGEGTQRHADSVVVDASRPSPQDKTAIRTRAFSDSELMLLLTELAHIFGDDHDGVNELLGFTTAPACSQHDRCFGLSEPSASVSPDTHLASCVSAKWQAWDEYLEAATRAAITAHSSISNVPDSGRNDAKRVAIQAAATAFQRTVATNEDAQVWHARVERQREHIVRSIVCECCL